jgi:hypothetical protein
MRRRLRQLRQNGWLSDNTMANPAGSFIWYELMTPDPDAKAAFYAAVF